MFTTVITTKVVHITTDNEMISLSQSERYGFAV